MTDLAPCPFCGNTPELEDHRLCWFARCSGCGAGVMGDRAPEPERDLPENYWESFRRSAVEKWNQRASAALAETVGEGVTDEELLELAQHHSVSYTLSDGSVVYPLQEGCDMRDDVLSFARAGLARYGHQPAPPAAGEVGELVAWLRDRAESTSLAHNALRITRAADLLERQAAPVPVAIPGEEYHEDMGAVTWWRFPVDEPPWVGTPNDSDWPGYHTHFTPAPPEPATALPLPAGEVQP